jgi:PAS domain-containing protein
MTITPVRDEAGGIAHLVAIKQDVTASRIAQIELKAERDFAQQVMNTMGQGLGVADRNGPRIYANPAAR